jgi:FtsH-binding integral membrane protein
LAVSAAAAATVGFLPPLQRLLLAITLDWTLPTGFGLALVATPIILVLAISAAGATLTVKEANLLYWIVAAVVGGAAGMVAFALAYDSLFPAFAAATAVVAVIGRVGPRIRNGLEDTPARLVAGLGGAALAAALSRLVSGSMFGLLLNVAGMLALLALIAARCRRTSAALTSPRTGAALETSLSWQVLALIVGAPRAGLHAGQ